MRQPLLEVSTKTLQNIILAGLKTNPPMTKKLTSNGGSDDLSEGKVSAESIHISITWPKLEQISLSILACVEATKPTLGPQVLSVVAVPFLLVVPALLRLGPAEIRVYVRDVSGVPITGVGG
jgi:hypothetical protein